MKISDIIAAGSLLVAIVALVKSFLSDRKVKALDVQLKEKELQSHEFYEMEMKKGDVEVKVVKAVGNRLNELHFLNIGRSEARNVRFEITSDIIENDITLRMRNDYLPYPRLQPGQSFDVAYYDRGDKPYHTVLMTWDDDSAEGRSKEMVVEM